MQELLDSVRTLSSKERKALAALLKRQGVNLYSVTPILPRTAEEPLTLSYAQQRQWFLWQLEPLSSAYNLSTALRLKGRLDYPALQRSFTTLLQRHESLRTIFLPTPEGVVQSIQPVLPLQLQVEAIAEVDLDARVEQALQHCFDLSTGPLFQVNLLRMAEDDHALVLVQHHILSDGWSMAIMVDELVQLYQGFCQGQEISLADLPIQYADYALWQRRWMEAGEQERQLGYWQQQLGGEQPVLELPLDHPRPAVQDYRGAALEVPLGAELSRRLKALAQQQGVTLFMLLLASLQALLQRYSGQNDIRVGVPIANRSRVETEGLIGFFVNTQVLKAEFDISTTVAELLAQVKRTALEAQAHQDLPFEQLVEALQPQRSLSHTPLFQVLFNHQTRSQGQVRELSGLTVEALERKAHSAQFDLILNTFESADGVSASFNFAVALFEPATIERMAGHWRNLLRAMTLDVQQPVAGLPLLAESEKRDRLAGQNQAAVIARVYVGVMQQLDARAQAQPDAVALLAAQGELSHGELAARSNRLARYLRSRGVGPEVLVGICVSRGPDMLVGLLAILKAGGAYVPLDPDFPAERLQYMVQASGLGLLLTQADLLEQLPLPERVSRILLDQDARQWQDADAAPLPGAALPQQLAYVIYTSGSTGKPKGVAISHAALANFLAGMSRALGDTPRRALALTSLSFDIAALELYWPLVNGGSVVLLRDGENKDPLILTQVIESRAVELIQATPSTWRMLMGARNIPDLKGKTLLCGGEALPADLAQQLLDQAGTLWNMYGPTETTIWSAVARLTPGQAINLGQPVDNNRLYALARDLEPVVSGCAAELYIGGDGLARGYFAQPGLTAERFVPDPWSAPGARLYRSGDRVRMDESGVCHYLGRLDHQVKIRGLRIELGEIDRCAQAYEAVRDAVVIDVEGPLGRQLLGYVVPVVADTDPREGLKAHLRARLPAYMVPDQWLLLAAMPLTPNGKLDRKALPAATLADSQGHVAPRTVLESRLAALWAQALGREQVGIDDDFFASGGHSILVLSLLERMRETLQEAFSLHEFMTGPTIRQQAEILRVRQPGLPSALVPMSVGRASAPRLFCLPPAGGVVFSYYPLAHHLADYYRVYGVLHRSIIEPGMRYDSWDAMVEGFMADILAEQGHGPYHLLGWSSGGLLAMAIANRLEARGEQVQWLGLVDSALPQSFAALYRRADQPAAQLAQDNEFSQLAAVIKGFFADKTDESLSALWAEANAQGQTLNPVDYVLAQLAHEQGMDPQRFTELYDVHKRAAEMAIGFDIYQQVLDLQVAAEILPLRVQPACWWSTRTFSDLEALRHSFEQSCAVAGVAGFRQLDISHDQICRAPLFLAQLVEVVASP